MADFSLTASDEIPVGVDDAQRTLVLTRFVPTAFAGGDWALNRNLTPNARDSILSSTTGISAHSRTVDESVLPYISDSFNGPVLGPLWESVGNTVVADGDYLSPITIHGASIINPATVPLTARWPARIMADFLIPTPAVLPTTFHNYTISYGVTRVYLDSRGASWGGGPEDWVAWAPGNLVESNPHATFPVVAGEWMRLKAETGSGAGDLYRIKIWRRDDPEPAGWTLDSVASTTYNSDRVSLQLATRGPTLLAGGIDNLSITPLDAAADSVRIKTPWVFTPEMIDGFDTYTVDQSGSSGQVSPAPGPWSYWYRSFIRSGGRDGGRCLQISHGSDTGGVERLLTPESTRIVGMAFKVQLQNFNTHQIFTLYESGNPGINFSVWPVSTYPNWPQTGHSCLIQLSVGGTTIGQVYRPIFNKWCHVTLKARTHPSAGRLILLIDDEEVINTTAATQNIGPAYHSVLSMWAGYGTLYDDVYVGSTTDSSGSIADMWGDVRIVSALASGAGDLSDFTAVPAGTNWERVADQFPDGDSTYTRSLTPGDVDLYAVSPGPTTSILAARPFAIARKGDIGPRTGRLVTKVSGVSYEGPEITPPDTYGRIDQILTASPDTGTVWDQSELDTVQVGMKIES